MKNQQDPMGAALIRQRYEKNAFLFFESHL